MEPVKRAREDDEADASAPSRQRLDEVEGATQNAQGEPAAVGAGAAQSAAAAAAAPAETSMEVTPAASAAAATEVPAAAATEVAAAAATEVPAAAATEVAAAAAPADEPPAKVARTEPVPTPAEIRASQAEQQPVAVAKPAAAAPVEAPAAEPQKGAQQQAAPPQSQPAANKLKVEDALSYLDEVKFQFQKMPEVYNKFLDIMKEFKSANIDTPGVIRRVAELFEGHTKLIVGFNTFLPPGFEIKAQNQQFLVTITENRGDGNSTTREQLVGRTYPTQHVQGQYNMQQQHPMAAQQQHMQMQQQQQQHHQRAPQQQQQQQQQQAADPASKNSPLEFNHAIQYVNKIKQRFEKNQQVYKDFLEILHTYQKEQKSIGAVYHEVEKLFKLQPDLLEEFAQFLPEAGPEHEQAIRQQQEQAARQASQFKHRGNKKANFSKKDMQEMADRMADRSELYIQELAQFDRIRRVLQSKEVYENFLRCLNLYSHEIVNRQELCHDLVPVFLGNHPELFSWFKNFVGYQDRGPDDGGKKMVQQHDLDLRNQKRMDKSYRQLPSQLQKPICTGRAQLDDGIRKTMNDKWVSFATRSEESAEESNVYPPSKKNMHEEAIFRCEDERFEIDIILEANLCTIAVLDSVIKQLQTMTPEQVANFKFDVQTLGGSSDVIHVKAVQRLYGDRTDEVLTALEKDPINNIPLVLKRLRQKQSEWRATQRSWNHVWRELMEKHYLRSLDYKGPAFKKTDPGNIKPKALRDKMNEQQAEYRAWRKKKLAAGERLDGGDGPPEPIIEFEYTDIELLNDVTNLVSHAAKFTSPSAVEPEHITAVLTSFIPELLFLEPQGGPVADAFMDDLSKAVDKSGGGAAAAAAAADGAGAAAMDATAAVATTPNASGPTAGKRRMGVDGENTHLFIANKHWFQVIRLHQILYSRLLEVKQHCNKLVKEQQDSTAPEDATPVSVSLALKAPLEVGVGEYYKELLDMISKLLEGTMEVANFEETCREMFNIHAYKLFTIDKVLTHLTKKIAVAVSDDTSRAAVGLYFRSQADPTIEYVREAYQLLNDQNVFAIEQKTARKMVIELLDFDVDAGHDVKTSTESWLEYVDKYTSSETTDPTLEAALEKHPVFLKRNKKDAGHESEGEALKDVDLDNSLECKICVTTYKMFFVAEGGEDYFHRCKTVVPAAKPGEDQSERSRNFRGFLNKWTAQHVTSHDREACDSWLTGPAAEPVAAGDAAAADAAAATATATADADPAAAAAAAAAAPAEAAAPAPAEAEAPAAAAGGMDTAADDN